MSADKLRKKLIRALEGGRLDFDDVVAKARTGEMQFHEVPGAVGVTTIGVSGPFRTCYCLAVAGERLSLPALERKIVAFARSSACQVLEANGRRGWTRIHSKLADGYTPSTVQFRKTLE